MSKAFYNLVLPEQTLTGDPWKKSTSYPLRHCDPWPSPPHRLHSSPFVHVRGHQPRSPESLLTSEQSLAFSLRLIGDHSSPVLVIVLANGNYDKILRRCKLNIKQGQMYVSKTKSVIVISIAFSYHICIPYQTRWLEASSPWGWWSDSRGWGAAGSSQAEWPGSPALWTQCRDKCHQVSSPAIINNYIKQINI